MAVASVFVGCNACGKDVVHEMPTYQAIHVECCAAPRLAICFKGVVITKAIGF